eukprot:gene133-229_t
MGVHESVQLIPKRIHTRYDICEQLVLSTKLSAEVARLKFLIDTGSQTLTMLKITNQAPGKAALLKHVRSQASGGEKEVGSPKKSGVVKKGGKDVSSPKAVDKAADKSVGVAAALREGQHNAAGPFSEPAAPPAAPGSEAEPAEAGDPASPAAAPAQSSGPFSSPKSSSGKSCSAKSKKRVRVQNSPVRNGEAGIEDSFEPASPRNVFDEIKSNVRKSRQSRRGPMGSGDRLDSPVSLNMEPTRYCWRGSTFSSHASNSGSSMRKELSTSDSALGSGLERKTTVVAPGSSAEDGERKTIGAPGSSAEDGADGPVADGRKTAVASAGLTGKSAFLRTAPSNESADSAMAPPASSRNNSDDGGCQVLRPVSKDRDARSSGNVSGFSDPAQCDGRVGDGGVPRERSPPRGGTSEVPTAGATGPAPPPPGGDAPPPPGRGDAEEDLSGASCGTEVRKLQAELDDIINDRLGHAINDGVSFDIADAREDAKAVAAEMTALVGGHATFVSAGSASAVSESCSVSATVSQFRGQKSISGASSQSSGASDESSQASGSASLSSTAQKLALEQRLQTELAEIIGHEADAATGVAFDMDLTKKEASQPHAVKTGARVQHEAGQVPTYISDNDLVKYLLPKFENPLLKKHWHIVSDLDNTFFVGHGGKNGPQLPRCTMPGIRSVFSGLAPGRTTFLSIRPPILEDMTWATLRRMGVYADCTLLCAGTTMSAGTYFVATKNVMANTSGERKCSKFL